MLCANIGSDSDPNVGTYSRRNDKSNAGNTQGIKGNIGTSRGMAPT